MEHRAQHTALVVEDDPVIRELLTDCLVGAGFDVLTAEDGAAAVELIDQTRAPLRQLCLILLDLLLPELPGLAVLAHVQARAEDLPVVAMSARPDLLAQARQAGAAETLAKPFDIPRLLAIVAEHCPHGAERGSGS
ncbi:MAG TPA: response regulator [Chloroflexota bacterium]|jgi:two-component system phosphate regulon response regulator OmpR